MKGQAPLISYSLTVLLGIILIFLFSTMLFSFYSSFLKSEIKNNLENLAISLSNNIIAFYEFANTSNFFPKNSSCFLIGEKNLEFPKKILNRNYEIFVKPSEENFLIVATTQDPLETVENKIPKIQVSFQGKIKSGKSSKLYYYRCNLNNFITDKVVLGELNASSN
ncbi:MAG: hypothetical protein QW412_01020 [Candidatus Aenigmatarchaeota archaeon]